MKISDIKPGMKLRGVGTYADDCIVPGGEYEAYEHNGSPHIICGCGGSHDLRPTADESGEIPELEPA